MLTEFQSYYLRVAHRRSQPPQVGSQRLLDTSRWLTEALRHLSVAHRGFQKPRGWPTEALRTLIDALITLGCSQRLSDNTELLTEALRYLRMAHRDSNTSMWFT